LKGSVEILGSIKINSTFSSMEIISNLRKELTNHLAKERAINYESKHRKELLTNLQVDIELFTYAARNVPMYLK